jgi:hypothetical protein
MNERTKPSGDSLLQRWSRLKSEARARDRTGLPLPTPDAAATPVGVVPSAADAGTAPDTPPIARDATAQRVPAVADDALPPVESLTGDSDFSAFMQPQVDEALKRRALKQLFRDPHFNVMDGLDVYIDDYSKPDPISPEIVREMVQGRYIFDPPPTRINARGHVEDIPEDEPPALERDAEDAARPADTAQAAVAASGLPAAEVDEGDEADADAVTPPPSGDVASDGTEANGHSGAGPAPAANDRAAR